MYVCSRSGAPAPVRRPRRLCWPRRPSRVGGQRAAGETAALVWHAAECHAVVAAPPFVAAGPGLPPSALIRSQRRRERGQRHVAGVAGFLVSPAGCRLRHIPRAGGHVCVVRGLVRLAEARPGAAVSPALPDSLALAVSPAITASRTTTAAPSARPLPRFRFRSPSPSSPPLPLPSPSPPLPSPPASHGHRACYGPDAAMAAPRTRAASRWLATIAGAAPSPLPETAPAAPPPASPWRCRWRWRRRRRRRHCRRPRRSSRGRMTRAVRYGLCGSAQGWGWRSR